MMSPDERQEFERLQRTVGELSEFIARNFNPDGTPKNPMVVISASDSVTTPSGSIRINTNLGPRNILVV